MNKQTSVPEIRLNSKKPLFIPLNTKHYEAFEDGSKDTEYRLHGKRWNEVCVWKGRAVTLSKGYGKKNRLYGVVRDVWVTNSVSLRPDVQEAIKEIYGEGIHEIFCIGVKLSKKGDWYADAPNHIGKTRFA